MSRLVVPIMVALVLLSACSSSKEQADAPEPRTYVDVRNRHWLSMTIYVDGAQRVRLGRLKSGESQRYQIPSYLLSGATPIRFVMESSGSSPTILSEELVVVPGEEVVLVIPNTR